MIKERSQILRNVLFSCLFFIMALGGCVTTSRVDYPSYQLDEDEYQIIEINKSVYISPINLGIPRVSQFKEIYGTIHSEIGSYMLSNGFNVLPSKEYENSFRKNMGIVGGLFDQKSGKRDPKLLDDCIIKTINELKQKNEFSAVVLPYLLFSHVEVERPFMKGSWDGVNRKVQITSRSGISFKVIKTMSLQLIVFSSNGSLLFKSQGGIDFIQKIVDFTNGEGIGVSLVAKESKDFSIKDIREGIKIAFHPFIFCERIDNLKNKSNGDN